MKPNQEVLLVLIDKRLKDKMWANYVKTHKSLKLQVTEALELYFKK